ncbi:sterile alpha motif domain-containing protein 9-like [Salminus brasiliensis]|uniref:sterile alpha motif domain-containing protein 9-like n=1 Tax=Salminus brasiliensis TaxID=930266 RepID=UPI003B830CA9
MEYLALPDTTTSCKQEMPLTQMNRETSNETEAVSCKTEMPSQRPHFQRAEKGNEDVNPLLRKVLPIVSLRTVVPAAFRSFANSCRVVAGRFLTVLSIIATPRGEIFFGAPGRDQFQISATNSNREVKEETDHGEKLKNLLTCGASTLGHYSYFIIVMNKGDPDQLEHLQFLCKLNLFCVLDFDPNSNTNGACKQYREFCHANLHFPTHFQGEPRSVVKNLNLYHQTSWVFCNGRLDLDSRHLDYQHWLKVTHREIEQMVSFMFKPEILPGSRCLVIFLLLSSVESEKDPIFDTFMTFHRQCGGEENIIHICKNENTFDKWQSLIQKKYEFDIRKQSIYELNWSQVNGQIMKLGPHSQPFEKLLPSAGCSSVILKTKDAQRMNTLEILCENECEGAYDENSSEFHNVKLEVEEEFYRGGEVKWLNFYISEKRKAKPFIKRDKYEAVRTKVTSQIKHAKSTCVLVNLFHHPGCGGTTLAKHVMWDLRNQFRCAVLKDSSADEQVASQIMDLMKYGKSDESLQTPVLLLVDDSKDTEAAEKLRNCIRRQLDKNCLGKKEKSLSSPVIILNCVRTHFPKVQYKCCETESQYITAELTKKEQDDFEEKLQELKENHERPENFYSFMIMKSNFDQKYVKNIVCNILKDLDMDTRQAQLLSIMALLNSYIPESNISQSVCEDFLGMKPLFWGKETVLEKMEPYSNLLIGSKGGPYGEYSTIRMQHHDIACACLEELDLTYNIKRSDITMNLLHCDLFFRTGLGKDALILFIQRMLIERQRNVENERNTQFSLLIEKIHKDEERQKVHDIFMKASSRYETSASIPQALARYLYLYERDFSQALGWAENATKITENSFTVDTIGQIHKNHLKYKIQQVKEQEMSCSSEHLDAFLEIAKKATNAFQRAQKLSKTENEPYEDCYLTKDSYNQSADMGVIETALIIFEIISSLPFFDLKDPLTRRQLQSFLKGNIPIISVRFEDNVVNQKYVDVLKKHEQFLPWLKVQAKTSFEFFDRYFIYLKSRKFEEESGHRCRRKVSEHFKKYISFFTLEDEWAQKQPGKTFLRENMDIEAQKMFLEEQKADTFAGLLQHLEDKSGETMEKITECYTFLNERSKPRNPNFKTNLMLANLILHLLKPKSKCIMHERALIQLLRQTMQEVGVKYSFPEPYYLALLLLWPCSSTPDIDKNIGIYIDAIRSSSRHQLPHSLRKRGAISHFLLGKKSGLKRLVPKAKLYFSKDPKESNRLWQSGDIFAQKDIKDCLLRVHGTVEQGEVYIEHGKHKIPVHPAFLDAVRTGYSTEKVSFYLGFAMTGPLAYDIQYEN